MRCKKLRFIGILWLLVVFSISSYPSDTLAKDTIIWLTFDYPPMRITKGEQQGQGIGDLAVKYLQEQMPEYNHKDLEVNLKRLFYTLKKEEKVFAIGLVKTPEREEFLHYSIPAVIRPGLSVVIRKDKVGEFGRLKTISLAEILKNKQWKLGIDGDRSYTSKVDAVLKQHQGQKNLVVRTGYDMITSYLKMLSKGNIDALIEYPSQVKYISREAGLLDQFYTITLEEAPRYTVSYVVCPKNEWGKKMIERVNSILTQGRPTDEYRSFIERWVSEEGRGEFRKAYSEFLSL